LHRNIVPVHALFLHHSQKPHHLYKGMLQSGTRRSNKKFRPSHKIPSLPPRHPLELARIKCEDAITKYQALIHLEEGEVDVVERFLHRKHDHHRTIPIPIILKGEASSHVALADVLRLQSSWCHYRSINKQHLYLSARGETATELYEKATQCCDVAAGIAGTIGNHAVEAEALRALSDVAESRHVDDVAEHRLERAISLLKLISKEEMELNDKKIQRQLNEYIDKQQSRQIKLKTRKIYLLELQNKLGRSAVIEEEKVTNAFVEVVKRRSADGTGTSEGKSVLLTYETAKKRTLDMDAIFEVTQRLGTVPALSEEELIEVMCQMTTTGIDDTKDVNVNEQTRVSLEDFIVWWLDGC
jgi:hypothetical protein